MDQLRIDDAPIADKNPWEVDTTDRRKNFLATRLGQVGDLLSELDSESA